MTPIDYLTSALGKPVCVVLHNDSFDGRLVNYDMTMSIVTLEGMMADEPYTIHIRTESIEAIVIH